MARLHWHVGFVVKSITMIDPSVDVGLSRQAGIFRAWRHVSNLPGEGIAVI
jgi:hypothetical protein